MKGERGHSPVPSHLSLFMRRTVVANVGVFESFGTVGSSLYPSYCPRTTSSSLIGTTDWRTWKITYKNQSLGENSILLYPLRWKVTSYKGLEMKMWLDRIKKLKAIWVKRAVITFTFSSRMCSGLREIGFSMATRQRTCSRLNLVEKWKHLQLQRDSKKNSQTKVAFKGNPKILMKRINK